MAKICSFLYSVRSMSYGRNVFRADTLVVCFESAIFFVPGKGQLD